MKKNDLAVIQGIVKRVMLLIKNRFLHNSFDAKIVLILPSTIHPIRCHWGAGKINMLSSERHLQKGKACYWQHTDFAKWLRISEVDFLWRYVDWARNKFPLSALTGVLFKGVEIRENPIKPWINFLLFERSREERDSDGNERHGPFRLEQSGNRSGIDYPTKRR